MSVFGNTLAGTLVTFNDGQLLRSTATGYEVTLRGQTFALNFFWLTRHEKYAMLVSTSGRNLGYVNVAPDEFRLFPGGFDDGVDLVVGFAANDKSVKTTPGTVVGQFGAMLVAGVFD